MSRRNIGSSHRPLRDVVCDAIRDQIINGEHEPGSRLVEDRLADGLGVSRNPVREALRVLEAEGFVSMIPRRGAVVATLTQEEVNDIFEVRRALEALAARLAARRATPTQLKSLRKVLADADLAVTNGDAARITQLNSRFHEMVLDLAGNGYLKDVMLPLRGRTQWIFSLTAGARGRHSLREHGELVEAIVDGDEDRAGRLAEAHIGAAQESFIAGRDGRSDGDKAQRGAVR